jgi:hypothetical protein
MDLVFHLVDLFGERVAKITIELNVVASSPLCFVESTVGGPDDIVRRVYVWGRPCDPNAGRHPPVRELGPLNVHSDTIGYNGRFFAARLGEQYRKFLAAVPCRNVVASEAVLENIRDNF